MSRVGIARYFDNIGMLQVISQMCMQGSAAARTSTLVFEKNFVTRRHHVSRPPNNTILYEKL